jgi:hypothetical protein
MAWSEEQKTRGRAELTRRRIFENASTYRASFLKAVCSMILCLVAGIVDLYALSMQANWLPRSFNILFLPLVTYAFGVSGLFSYVRFLDWRRAASRTPV